MKATRTEDTGAVPACAKLCARVMHRSADGWHRVRPPRAQRAADGAVNRASDEDSKCRLQTIEDQRTEDCVAEKGGEAKVVDGCGLVASGLREAGPGGSYVMSSARAKKPLAMAFSEVHVTADS